MGFLWSGESFAGVRMIPTRQNHEIIYSKGLGKVRGTIRGDAKVNCATHTGGTLIKNHFPILPPTPYTLLPHAARMQWKQHFAALFL